MGHPATSADLGGLVNFICSCGQRRNSGLARCFFLLLAVVMLAPATPAQNFDKKAVIKQARQAYYSLKDQGLADFQCGLTPNWRSLLNEQKLDAETVNRASALLDKIHFSMTLPAAGNAQVTHNEVSADNPQAAEGLKQIYSGMEQMTTGFFQTWSAFSMTPALPEIAGDYQLEKTGNEYRLTYKDGAADIVTMFDQNFAITYLKTTAPEFDSTMRPKFMKTPKGLLLSGYSATYAGKSAADTTELQVAIDYQEVDTLQLPQRLDLKGSYGGSPFHVEVTFAECHATRR